MVNNVYYFFGMYLCQPDTVGTVWRTQRGGGVGGSNPPIESSKKFVFCVSKPCSYVH